MSDMPTGELYKEIERLTISKIPTHYIYPKIGGSSLQLQLVIKHRPACSSTSFASFPLSWDLQSPMKYPAEYVIPSF
jgi:hypothetical protein